MAEQKKPNVLLVLADDVGWFDVGAYHRGIMGAPTPNIDRIAQEGALLTDCYAQASCTAGRAAFITGQLPMRTGLATVGFPGATQGLQPEDPTLAELLKPQGYMTAQIGKNHLGDRNEYLPTVHGFDEFYGNLYHLNAEEEPEQADYPRDHPAFQNFFKPRGVLDCKAREEDDPTEDHRFGRVGKQTIIDTGPLTRKRMETIEADLLAHSLDFIDRAHAANRPFLLWHNTTRTHVWTRLSERWRDITKFGVYADGMQELDWVVGELLAKLDRLGMAENTIVVFTTDNGAQKIQLARRWDFTLPGRKRIGMGGRVPSSLRHALARENSCRAGAERYLLSRRYRADHHGRRWRLRYQGKTVGRLPSRRQALPHSSRRLQSASLSQRGERCFTPARVFLLRRTRTLCHPLSDQG